MECTHHVLFEAYKAYHKKKCLLSNRFCWMNLGHRTVRTMIPVALGHSRVIITHWSAQTFLDCSVSVKVKTTCSSIKIFQNAWNNFSWSIHLISNLCFALFFIHVCIFLFFQPLSPSCQRLLKHLTDKHGSGKIFQVTNTVVGTRDFDLNLTKGEFVALISEFDTHGDKRRWLVDSGGKNYFYQELVNLTGLKMRKFNQLSWWKKVIEKRSTVGHKWFLAVIKF